MLALNIEAVTGHYRVPGQVSNMGVAHSFPQVPPSTMAGSLKSFGGITDEDIPGQFAYGPTRPAGGHGVLTRRAHVWTNTNSARVIRVETWFDVAYTVLVRGPLEERLRAALRGEVRAFGVLYLGESEDLVHWINEVQDPSNVKWVTPGTEMALTIQAGRGYDTINNKMGLFDLRAGNPHWMPI